MEPVYSLAEAVDRFLPGGVWTVSSLRTEIRKGRLQVERIAGKFGVTESAIEEMRKLCRESGFAFESIGPDRRESIDIDGFTLVRFSPAPSDTRSARRPEGADERSIVKTGDA